VNESYSVGSYGYNIAHPMIVVIDPDGNVARRFSHEDHTIPPSIDAVLTELRKE